MCVLFNRISVVVGASIIALAGCQSMGDKVQPLTVNDPVPVPADTQLIVLAYDKNISLGNLSLTNLPADVQVLFISDTSAGYANVVARDKNLNAAKQCSACQRRNIKNDHSCDVASQSTPLCEAFDNGNSPKKQSTVTEHFDIYSTFGSCTKQVCPYPGWCYTIGC
jgi:hypothetical protein